MRSTVGLLLGEAVVSNSNGVCHIYAINTTEADLEVKNKSLFVAQCIVIPYFPLLSKFYTMFVDNSTLKSFIRKSKTLQTVSYTKRTKLKVRNVLIKYKITFENFDKNYIEQSTRYIIIRIKDYENPYIEHSSMKIRFK